MLNALIIGSIVGLLFLVYKAGSRYANVHLYSPAGRVLFRSHVFALVMGVGFAAIGCYVIIIASGGQISPLAALVITSLPIMAATPLLYVGLKKVRKYESRHSYDPEKHDQSKIDLVNAARDPNFRFTVIEGEVVEGR